jgi:hypothetical protein
MRTDSRAAIPFESMRSKAAWHRTQASLPIQDKLRILLRLQEEDLPLLQKQRPLKYWEKPWPIEP